MKERYSNGDVSLKPNKIILTSIINVCGYPTKSPAGKKSSLKVLLECMLELQTSKFINPDSMTMCTLLNALKFSVENDAQLYK
ncbi:hypothetical protein ACHAXS_012324, partial [Conticribra weissflogii]